MANLIIEVIKIALKDAEERQKLINENFIQNKPINDLLEIQTKLLEGANTLINRID